MLELHSLCFCVSQYEVLCYSHRYSFVVDWTGFKCSVLCDDEPLKSYDATVADRGVSGWIASEVGRVRLCRMLLVVWRVSN